MKRATNGLAGRECTCSGVPICCTRPSCITTRRSASAIASVWSCVTMIVVMPPSLLQDADLARHLLAQRRHRDWTAAHRAAARADGSPARVPVRHAAAGRRKAGAAGAARMPRASPAAASPPRAPAIACAGHAPHLQPERDIARDGQMRKQRVALEHDAHLAPMRRQRGDAGAVEPDVAGASAARSRRSCASVVVLPQPDGPSSTISSPGRTSSVTASTAVCVPNCLLSASSASAAAVIAPSGPAGRSDPAPAAVRPPRRSAPPRPRRPADRCGIPGIAARRPAAW